MIRRLAIALFILAACHAGSTASTRVWVAGTPLASPQTTHAEPQVWIPRADVPWHSRLRFNATLELPPDPAHR